MRAARLHAIRDLRIEDLPVPQPGPGELLVRVEGCGVCPTDVRKWAIGLNDGEYPFNPGHEWVGRIEATGSDTSGWDIGRRVYGDTYAGYAEYALLSTSPGRWSHGPLALPDGLPLERAIFVEPFADCLHAVRDQARVAAGDRVVVVGGGQMGQQLVVAAKAAGARVVLVEPLEKRRALALDLGADWAATELAEADAGAQAVILSIGVGALVQPSLELAAPGGRVVLFAGFGDEPRATVDLNRIHYEELALVGSEWIGAPPNTRRERYAEALELLVSGEAPLERLVTGRCSLEELEQVFEDVQAYRRLKTILVP